MPSWLQQALVSSMQFQIHILKDSVSSQVGRRIGADIIRPTVIQIVPAFSVLGYRLKVVLFGFNMG